jgi:hypothetical protein
MAGMEVFNGIYDGVPKGRVLDKLLWSGILMIILYLHARNYTPLPPRSLLVYVTCFIGGTIKPRILDPSPRYGPVALRAIDQINQM